MHGQQQPCNAFMIKMFFDHERYTVVAHRLLLHLNLNLNGRRESVGRAPYVKSAQIRKEFSMSRHNISGAREPTFRAFDLDQTCAEVGSCELESRSRRFQPLSDFSTHRNEYTAGGNVFPIQP